MLACSCDHGVSLPTASPLQMPLLQSPFVVVTGVEHNRCLVMLPVCDGAGNRSHTGMVGPEWRHSRVCAKVRLQDGVARHYRRHNHELATTIVAVTIDVATAAAQTLCLPRFPTETWYVQSDSPCHTMTIRLLPLSPMPMRA